jgi:hypothetical protein
MKRTSKLLACAITILIISVAVPAQAQAKVPKWLPENGNWMVESNINKPLHYVIYFYTNEGEVIYKETLVGLKLRLEKRTVKMRLKKVLESALTAWNQNKQLAEEQQWVVKKFR